MSFDFNAQGRHARMWMEFDRKIEALHRSRSAAERRMLFGGGTPALQIEYEETRRALSLQINSLVQGRDQLDVEYARYCAERS